MQTRIYASEQQRKTNHARFFQQVVEYVATNRRSSVVELDVHVLSESRWVVVSVSFCVTESLRTVDERKTVLKNLGGRQKSYCTY